MSIRNAIELTKSAALGHGIGDGPVLHLGTGAQNCRLMLGGPGYKCIAKVDTIAPT